MNPLSGELTFVDASGWIALVNANDTLHQQSVRLFEQRLNEGRGFVTISFTIMQERNIVEALAGDRHFQQAGFVALP
jgi:predicted nucleic acid-binding protein